MIAASSTTATTCDNNCKPAESAHFPVTDINVFASRLTPEQGIALTRAPNLPPWFLKLKFHRTVFLVASSWHPREDVRNKSCVSGVFGDFPVQLAYLIGRPAVCCGVVLPVCLCVGVGIQSPRVRHARLVTDILLHVRHVRFPRDLLATSSRRLMRMLRGKLLSWNLSLTTHPSLVHTHTHTH